MNVFKHSFSLCLICCTEICYSLIYVELTEWLNLALNSCFSCFVSFLFFFFKQDVQICRRNSSAFSRVVFSRRMRSRKKKVWHVFRKKSIRSEDWPMRIVVMFFVWICNLCILLADRLQASVLALKYTASGKGEVACILYWPASGVQYVKFCLFRFLSCVFAISLLSHTSSIFELSSFN